MKATLKYYPDMPIDGQVCFHRQHFAVPVKPRQSTTGYMEPLKGINKAAWGVKLLPTTISASHADLWLFLCFIEDTILLSVSQWMVLPAFRSPPTPSTLPTIFRLPTPYKLNL